MEILTELPKHKKIFSNNVQSYHKYKLNPSIACLFNNQNSLILDLKVTSTVQVLTGDVEGAVETQKKCGNALLRTADGIPIVGHAKGVIHYACGDKEGGNKAMMSATRTTGVMGAGAAGFLVGGPVGAVAAGVAGGAAFDTSFTVIDSVANDAYRPSGYYAAIDNIVKNPNAGDIFDTCFIPVGDGLAGYSGGRLVNKFTGTSSGNAGTSGQPTPPGAAELAKGE